MCSRPGRKGETKKFHVVVVQRRCKVFFLLILYALVMFLNRVFRKEWFNRFPWFLASLMKKGRTLRKCYIFSRCTNSWSNLTLKCNANTFVKVDARIEGNCRRTISPICKGILVQSFSCKKSKTYREYSSQYKKNNFHSPSAVVLYLCVNFHKCVSVAF